MLVVVGALVLLAACSDSDTRVIDLGDSDLEDLCEQFFDDVCQGTLFPNCNPECRSTCRDPGTAALMRQECISPITVGDVDRCAALVGADDESAFGVCTMGGGCVFDVFDSTCP